MSKSTSRRAVLAGIAIAPAAAALTTPAVALATSSSTPDPIFAAIEARKQAERRSYYEVGSRLDVDEETEKDCANADAEALRTMFLTVPTTAAGAIALLRYVRDCEAEGDDITQIIMDEDEERQGVSALFDTLISALTSSKARIPESCCKSSVPQISE